MEIRRGILKEILWQIHHYSFPCIDNRSMLCDGILVTSKVVNNYELKLYLKCDTFTRSIYLYGDIIEFFFCVEISYEDQLVIKSDILDTVTLADTLKGRDFVIKFNSLVPKINQSIIFKKLLNIVGIIEIPVIKLSSKRLLKLEECFHHWYILLDNGLHYKLFPEYEKYYKGYSEKDKFELAQKCLKACPENFTIPVVYNW